MKRDISGGRFRLVAIALGLLVAVSACATSPPRDTGWELIVARDYAGARDYYEKVLRERPDDPYAHLNLGVAYEELGDKAAAEKHYRAALRLGDNAGVGEVADEGRVKPRRATVAEMAAENLRRLSGES